MTIPTFCTPLRRISFDLRTYKPKLFSSDLTYISMPIKSLPPCFRFKYNRPISLDVGPYTLSKSLLLFCPFFQLIYLPINNYSSLFYSATPQLLIAWILFLPFNLDLNINLNLLLYSALTLILISCSFILSNSRMPR